MRVARFVLDRWPLALLWLILLAFAAIRAFGEEPSYQWQRKGSEIAGASSSSLTPPAPPAPPYVPTNAAAMRKKVEAAYAARTNSVAHTAHAVVVPPAASTQGLYWINRVRICSESEIIEVYCRTGRSDLFTVWQSTNLLNWEPWSMPGSKTNRPIQTVPKMRDDSYLLTWFVVNPRTQRFFKVTP